MFVPGQMVHSQPRTCEAVDGPLQKAVQISWTLSGPYNIDVQAEVAPRYQILLIILLLFIEKFC